MESELALGVHGLARGGGGVSRQGGEGRGLEGIRLAERRKEGGRGGAHMGEGQRMRARIKRDN